MRVFLFVILFIFVFQCTTSYGQEIIKQRLLSDLLTPYDPSWAKSSTVYLTLLKEDGSFSDITYTAGLKAPATVWENEEHLARGVVMCQAVLSPSSPLYNNANLLSAAQKTLDFWLKNDYTDEGCTGGYNPKTCPSDTPGFWNPNWWHNQIGVPQPLSQFCLLLQPHLSSTQSAHCTKIMDRSNYNGFTGANVLWMSAIQVYNGVFSNNTVVTEKAFAASYSQLVVTPHAQDGIKQDGSFMQHVGQIYSGGYGQDFLDSVLSILSWGLGTTFEPTASQQTAFSYLLADGVPWMISYNPGGSTLWDISVKGREITRKTILTAHVASDIILQVTSKWPRASEIAVFAKRAANISSEPPLSGNRMFWSSDYMVHRRQDFFISLKMFSERTKNTECVNAENTKGIHLADGALYTYLNGHDYDMIFPEWNWYKIPGISVDFGGEPFVCGSTSFFGKTSFVGGVSDGTDGVAAFNFHSPYRSTLTFQKSWFFFDNVITVLITNITCPSSVPVYHVLDSRLLQGTPVVSSNQTVVIGNSTFSDVWWLHHNSIGYIFPEQIELNIQTGEVTGDWKSIGTATGMTTQSLFTAWLQHQKTPVKSDAIAYITRPAISLDQFRQSAAGIRSQIQIISNTPNLQAIFDSNTGIAGAIFWMPGNIKFPKFTIETNVPCAVMIKPSSHGLSLSISDPTQKLQSATLTINQQVKCSMCRVHPTLGKTLISISFPKDNFAGSSVTVAVTFTVMS